MVVRILIIASTLIFIAGCESELDRCIAANEDQKLIQIGKETNNEALGNRIAKEHAEKFCNKQGIY